MTSFNRFLGTAVHQRGRRQTCGNVGRRSGCGWIWDEASTSPISSFGVLQRCYSLTAGTESATKARMLRGCLLSRCTVSLAPPRPSASPSLSLMGRPITKPSTILAAPIFGTIPGIPFLDLIERRLWNSCLQLLGWKDETARRTTCRSDYDATKKFLASSSHQLSRNWSWMNRCLDWLHSWILAAWKACLVASRSTEVFLRLSPLMLLTPIATITQSSILTELSWRYAIATIQALGPVAVKFCQWVATRRDMFSPHLCDRLAILHDKGYPHSWEHTHRVLTEEFGDYQNKGLIIDKVVGCGSAAQVYKGRLMHSSSPSSSSSFQDDCTQTVAIKVLHPNFSLNIERDLTLMQTVADFLHSLPSDTIKLVNLPRATDNFGKILRLQADLNHEANNLRQFRSNFVETSRQNNYHAIRNNNDDAKVQEQKNYLERERRQFSSSPICFPQPVPGWSSQHVLVEDFVHDATPIATFLKDSSPDGIQLRRELAGPLLRAFLKMVFIDNFVHGDLHPGNVMVQSEVVPRPFFSRWKSFLFDAVALLPHPPEAATDMDENTNLLLDGEVQKRKDNDDTVMIRRKIVFLDAGIANSLSRKDQRNLIDLFQAVIFNNGDRAGRLMVERANYERCSQVPGGVDAFAKGVEEIVSEFHDNRKNGLTLGAVRIGGLLSRVLDLCRIHGVEIDPAMASVVISTLVLEGLGRSLSPELNLIDFAKPFVLGRGLV